MGRGGIVEQHKVPLLVHYQRLTPITAYLPNYVAQRDVTHTKYCCTFSRNVFSRVTECIQLKLAQGRAGWLWLVKSSCGVYNNRNLKN